MYAQLAVSMEIAFNGNVTLCGIVLSLLLKYKKKQKRKKQALLWEIIKASGPQTFTCYWHNLNDTSLQLLQKPQEKQVMK